MAKLAGAIAVTLALSVGVLAACGEGLADVDPTDPPRNTETATVEDQVGAGDAPPTKGIDELQQWDSPPAHALQSGVDYRAKLTTNFGEIVIDLFESEAPVTVNNFVFLANEGFYENVPFHRVLAGFVIQSGDPTGTGRGSPGYRFNDEPIVRDYTKGIVAMANSGENTNGSQFFITVADLSGRLPKNYTIFGEVIEGLDVVDRIAEVPVETGPPPSNEPSVPTVPVFISSVEIVTG